MIDEATRNARAVEATRRYRAKNREQVLESQRAYNARTKDAQKVKADARFIARLNAQ